MSFLLAASESFCQPHCTTGDAIVAVAGIIGFCVFFYILARY